MAVFHGNPSAADVRVDADRRALKRRPRTVWRSPRTRELSLPRAAALMPSRTTDTAVVDLLPGIGLEIGDDQTEQALAAPREPRPASPRRSLHSRGGQIYSRAAAENKRTIE